MKNLHIHIGPHKTGSSSVQHFLQTANVPGGEIPVVPIVRKDVAAAGRLMAKNETESATECLAKLAKYILSKEGNQFLLSCEDFSGELPGRSTKRRIYPRLYENIELVRTVFSDFNCKFYFFRRTPENWLNSVYAQNIRYDRKFASFDDFLNTLKVDALWDGVLQKCRNRLGEKFIEIGYDEADSFDTITALLQHVGNPDWVASAVLSNLKRLKVSPKKVDLEVVERINRATGSALAVKRARNRVYAKAEAIKSSVPPETAQTGDFDPSEGLIGLARRTESRVPKQDVSWLVPEIEFPLMTLWQTIVPEDEIEFPQTTRATMEGQVRILRFRMRGLPEPCFILALLISYLRRDTAHTGKARDLFLKMWQFEHVNLSAFLPTRWLISSLQTFLDHGESADQRLVGGSGYFFANVMKAYEAERGFVGLNAESLYPNTTPSGKNGGVGLDRFDLGRSDLMVNTLAMLYEISLRDERSGRVVRELLLRVKSGHTIFSRMDQSRIHHEIEPQGFVNCWSFFEDPRTR
jgi:hypothetical protein